MNEFEMAVSWPAMLHGNLVIAETLGMNLPIVGFIEATQNAGFEIEPILWCAAEPSAHVTDDAYERITDMILDALREAGPLDGVFLDLHGAMVTESLADGEGELPTRLRAQIGPDVPLIAILDLHANISERMVDQADYLAIFRTYPHLDMTETGARCVPIIQRLLRGTGLYNAFGQVPYLTPLHSQFTGNAPFSTLYNILPKQQERVVLSDVALGFTAADFPDTGPSYVVYADTQDEADAAAEEIQSLFTYLEPLVDRFMPSLKEAAQASRNSKGRSLIIADVQDNPGAGASSDATGLLQALMQGRCRNVLMGLFHDPEPAALAHLAGKKGRFHGQLRGKSGMPGQTPVECEFEVNALSDGHCRYSDAMYGGGDRYSRQERCLAVELWWWRNRHRRNKR